MKNVEMRRLRSFRAARKKFYLHEFAERENQGTRELVDWLNRSKETAQYDRIGCLIQRIREVRELMPPVSVREWMEKEMSTGSGSAPVWKKIRRINKQLSRHKMWPRYTGLRTRFISMDKHAGLSKSTRKKLGPLIWEWWPEGDFETKAAHQLVRLEEYGLFDSLLQCSTCDIWFFASRDWQRFCSARCRDQNYSASAEGRAKRARYMRGYRNRLKRMDEEMRRVSRKK